MSNIGNMDAMSKNLLYYMDKYNVSQKELSEITNVSQGTVCHWIKARRYPRIDKIEMMARYFGVTKSDLIESKTPEQHREDELNDELASALVDLNIEEIMRVLDFIAGIKSSRK